MPSTWVHVPWGVASGRKPKREITPSMSTNSNGRSRNNELFVGSLALGIKVGRERAENRAAASFVFRPRSSSL